jgi:hypothetical protein
LVLGTLPLLIIAAVTVLSSVSVIGNAILRTRRLSRQPDDNSGAEHHPTRVVGIPTLRQRNQGLLHVVDAGPPLRQGLGAPRDFAAWPVRTGDGASGRWMTLPSHRERDVAQAFIEQLSAGLVEIRRRFR